MSVFLDTDPCPTCNLMQSCSCKEDAREDPKTFLDILRERLDTDELRDTLCFWCGTSVRAEDSKYCGMACEEADRADNMTFGED